MARKFQSRVYESRNLRVERTQDTAIGVFILWTTTYTFVGLKCDIWRERLTKKKSITKKLQGEQFREQIHCKNSAEFLLSPNGEILTEHIRYSVLNSEGLALLMWLN